MKRENYPIYQKGIQFYLICDNKNFIKIIENCDLTHTEKTLLSARKLFSQNNFSEAIELLNTINPNCPFLHSEKSLLLATAYTNLGEPENSFLHNALAIEGYKKVEDQRGHFLATYNLSVDAGNLGLMKISDNYLERSQDLAKTLEENLLVKRARACSQSAMRKYSDAFNTIQEALNLCNEKKDQNTNILDILTLKVVASDIFFRAGRADLAKEILEEIKTEKLLKPKARVFFNFSLLRFLDGEKLTKMPKYVANSIEYSLKWKILTLLMTGDLKEAKKTWTDLMEAIPNSYLPDFEPATTFDEESIFYTCVKRIRSETSSVPDIKFPSGSKLEILHNRLLVSKMPLRKEELIEFVWKKPYDPSLNARFYKLIQRLKDHSLPIMNDQRAYFYKKIG